MQVNKVLLQQSEQGGRQYNQDRCAAYIDPDSTDIFVVVADGVGGSDRGEVAAQIVVDQSADFWQRRQAFADGTALLTSFVQACNQEIKHSIEQGVKTATTVVALLGFKGQLLSVHAGDSRLYQFNQQGKVGQTKDHSLAYAKFMMGEITEQQLATHPSQSQLLNCLNGEADLQIDINEWPAAAGQHFVLGTDGFWEVFADDDIATLIASEERETLFNTKLQQHLAEVPRHDNTTVIICSVTSGLAKSGPQPEQSAGSVLPPQTAVPLSAPTQKQENTAEKAALPAPKQRGISKVLLVLLLVICVGLGYVLYRDYQKVCCAKPDELQLAILAEQKVLLSGGASGLTSEQVSSSDDAETDEKTGSQTNVNDNLHSHYDKEIKLIGGQDAQDALLDLLIAQGDLAEGSVLQKTSETSDQHAEITKVQLMVNGVPVYGAVLVYRKTAEGIKLMNGKTAKLPLLPAAPAHDFAGCFATYQQAQAKADPVQLMPNQTPTLFIDAGSQSYFWLTPITIGEGAVPHDLFLSDNGCTALRLISRQVSG